MTGDNTYQYSDTLIIIFAREPISGQVKTRLIPSLGAKGALKLYSRLLDYAIDNVLQAKLCPLQLCITPESKPDYFLKKTQNENVPITLQSSGDLGERMSQAINQALKHYKKVILIGSDCPFLTKVDLQQAIIALDTRDMVYSPASDGGYVLVAAKNISASAFKNIQWGSERVMQQTRQNLLDNSISWKELTEQHDIDIPADLKYLTGSFRHFILD